MRIDNYSTMYHECCNLVNEFDDSKTFLECDDTIIYTKNRDLGEYKLLLRDKYDKSNNHKGFEFYIIKTHNGEEIDFDDFCKWQLDEDVLEYVKIVGYEGFGNNRLIVNSYIKSDNMVVKYPFNSTQIIIDDDKNIALEIDLYYFSTRKVKVSDVLSAISNIEIDKLCYSELPSYGIFSKRKKRNNPYSSAMNK